MPIHVSGPIDFTDLRAEFSFYGNPRELVGHYYAGGGLVPPGCEGTSGPIPTNIPANGWPMSLYYGACLAAPSPTASFQLGAEEGQQEGGIFAEDHIPQGYSAICQANGGPPFGSITSGSPIVSGGYANEGVDSVLIVQSILPIYDEGVVLNMINASYLSTEYSLKIQINQISSGALVYFKTFQSTSADIDQVASVNYGSGCGSTKNVRQLYWYVGKGGPGRPLYSGSDYRWIVDFARISG